MSHLYKVIFTDQSNVYEIYARSIAESNLFGFIEVEELVFGKHSSVVLDPSEERLRAEFSDVERTYIPLHNLLRIDVVQKEGAPKLETVTSETKDTTIHRFPNMIYPPHDD